MSRIVFLVLFLTACSPPLGPTINIDGCEIVSGYEALRAPSDITMRMRVLYNPAPIEKVSYRHIDDSWGSVSAKKLLYVSDKIYQFNLSFSANARPGTWFVSAETIGSDGHSWSCSDTFNLN